MPHYVVLQVDMIDCAIYQACLPGKSDKRNIYLQSSASKAPVMDEHRTECKINLPDTFVSIIYDKMSFFCLILHTNLNSVYM